MDYFESQCSHCPKVFTSENALKKHKFEFHYSVENKFDCNQCGKGYQSKLKLNWHTKNSHKKKFCELCNVFVSHGNFSRHKKEKHLVLNENLNPLFKCEKCGKALSRKEALENHMKSCGSIFNKEEDKSLLKTEKSPFPCVSCDKGFSKNKYLKAHMKTHETKKTRDPLETLNCYECGKNFDKLKSLKAHKKTHYSTESISCNHCDDVFKQKSSLNRHIKSKHPRPEIINAGSFGFMIPAHDFTKNYWQMTSQVPKQLSSFHPQVFIPST